MYNAQVVRVPLMVLGFRLTTPTMPPINISGIATRVHNLDLILKSFGIFTMAEVALEQIVGDA